MIMINKNVLKSFRPCEDRWKNFLTHYSEFDGHYDEFLDLEHISYDDKIWVSKKVLNINQLIHAAILCAESTLFIFEKKFPDDKRVRDCLSFMKSIVDFRSLTQDQRTRLIELRSGCSYSRRDAYAESAWSAWAATRSADSAAESAGWAATRSAAESAGWAAEAAAESAAWAADSAANWSAVIMSRDEARIVQQKLNLEFFKMAGAL